MAYCLPGSVGRIRLSLKQHLAGLGLAETKEQASDVSSPGADNAGDANDLALMQGETDVVQGTGCNVLKL